jgi:hypothetical protein
LTGLSSWLFRRFRAAWPDYRPPSIFEGYTEPIFPVNPRRRLWSPQRHRRRRLPHSPCRAAPSLSRDDSRDTGKGPCSAAPAPVWAFATAPSSSPSLGTPHVCTAISRSRRALPKASPSGRLPRLVASIPRRSVAGSGPRPCRWTTTATVGPGRLPPIFPTYRLVWPRDVRINPACGARSGSKAFQAHGRWSPSGFMPMALPLQVHHRLHPQRSPRHANSPGSSCKPKSSARRTSRHSGNVSSSTTS